VYVEAARKAKVLRLGTQHREFTLAKMDLEARVARQTRHWENVQNDLSQLELRRKEFVREGGAIAREGIPTYDAVANELRILEEQLGEDRLSPMLRRMNEAIASETKALQDEIGAVLRLRVKKGAGGEAPQG
jgi:dsDNA-specific endonuclease/ATPase MutS2